MKRYLLIIHKPDLPIGPVIGAKEVPPCFEPTEALLQAAAESGVGLSIVTEEELEAVGGLEGLLLRQGDHLLTALKSFIIDPSLN